MLKRANRLTTNVLSETLQLRLANGFLSLPTLSLFSYSWDLVLLALAVWKNVLTSQDTGTTLWQSVKNEMRLLVKIVILRDLHTPV